MTHNRPTVLVIALMVVAATGSAAVAAQPAPPAAYYGSVDVGGDPAPTGVTIEAVVDGEVVDSIVVEEEGQYGGSDALDDRLVADCNCTSGEDVVEFRLQETGEVANTTVVWESSDVQKVDLSFPNSDVGGDTGDDGSDGSDGSDGGGGGGGGVSTADDGAEIDVTSVDDGATVSVSDLPSGESAEADFSDEIAGQGVGLLSMSIDHRVTPDEYRVEITSVGTEPTGDAAELDAATAIGYLDIEPIGTDQIESAEIGFTVDEDALLAETSTDNVRLYHYDGGWEQLDTEHVGSDGGVHEFTATTDGFSPFAIGTASSDLAVTNAALANEEVPAGETVSVVDADATTDSNSGADGDAAADTEDESVIEEQAPGFGVIAGVIALLALGLLARRR